MKYIIIKGSKGSGKTATVRDICKRLNPSTVKQLSFETSGKPVLRPMAITDLDKDNYILKVKKRIILVVACAPTEQRKKISDIVAAIHSLDIFPEMAIIAMCGIEKLKDFATAKELEKLGECIHETKIWRIPSNQYHKTEEWDTRISSLTSLALKNM